VIDVLLAAAIVAANGLNVRVRERCDPHVGPCRRNDQLLDARDRVVVANTVAVRVKIHKTLSAAATPDAQRAISDITESRRLSGC
jgi:hypothetical protein